MPSPVVEPPATGPARVGERKSDFREELPTPELAPIIRKLVATRRGSQAFTESSFQAVSDTLISAVLEELDVSSCTAWVVVWARKGDGFWQIVPATMFAQLVVPALLIVENYDTASALCPMEATLRLKACALCMLYVLWLVLQNGRDESLVLRYLRAIFRRKCVSEPELKLGYLTVGVWTKSLSSALVMAGTAVLFHSSKDGVLGLLYNVLTFAFLVNVDNIALNAVALHRRRAASKQVVQWAEQQQDTPQHAEFVRWMQLDALNRVWASDAENVALVALQACELLLLVAVPICM